MLCCLRSRAGGGGGGARTDLDLETDSKHCQSFQSLKLTERQDVDPSCALAWFVESRNTSEEDLVVNVVEHDITSHKEGDTTLSHSVGFHTCFLFS